MAPSPQGFLVHSAVGEEVVAMHEVPEPQGPCQSYNMNATLSHHHQHQSHHEHHYHHHHLLLHHHHLHKGHLHGRCYVFLFCLLGQMLQVMGQNVCKGCERCVLVLLCHFHLCVLVIYIYVCIHIRFSDVHS